MMHAIELLSSQPWVERLGWTIVHFLWQGVLIAAVYAVARRFVTRPDQRYLLACAALAAMMAAPLATYGVMRPETPLSAGPVPIAAHAGARIPSAASTGVNILPAAGGVWPEQVLRWIVVVWFAGAIAFWMRLVGGWVVAARMRSMFVRPAPPEWQRRFDDLKARIGLSVPVRLLVSALVQVPSVVGWLRPVVLVPIGALTGLPPEHVEALLLHELAHIRRRDYLVNMLQGVAESLLFYHPAVWWVSGHIRTERELCCDDVAVSAGGGVLTYARALAELESFRSAHFNAAMAANGGSLTHRIARLLGQPAVVSRIFSGPGAAVSAALLVVTACAVFGQSTAPLSKFDVASIKPCRAGVGAGQGSSSPGRLSIGCLPLADTDNTGLIQRAYVRFASGHFHPLGMVPIVGGPDWIHSERYEIAAKAEGNASQETMQGPMMQALLEDRFKLKIHFETREVPVYALTVAKGGLKLKPFSEGNCALMYTFTPPLAPEPGQRLCKVAISSRPPSVDAEGSTLSEFSQLLNVLLDRSVIDKTGITSRFDIRLEFSPDETTPGLPGPASTADPTGPDIFTATQDQLGLKLVPTRGPGEFLVVDHVERPTEN